MNKQKITPAYTINVIDFNNSEYALRASGRTTRLADMYIQLLFSTGSIRVTDHHDTEQMNRYLLQIIVRRLQMEHSGVRFDVKGNLIVITKK